MISGVECFLTPWSKGLLIGCKGLVLGTSLLLGLKSNVVQINEY
jgi:hypothetical protein